MAFSSASGTRTRGDFLLISHGVREFYRYDASRHRNDSVTNNHHDRRQDLPDRRAWREVTVANSRQRYNRPVNADRDTRETIFFPFDDVHECADDDDEKQYR